MTRLASLRTLFGCDLRTLALLRVNLALLILVDLALRARDLTAHYSDLGIVPRSVLIEVYRQWSPSLHLLSGSAKVQALLFLLAAVFALALLVGYRTRIVTVACWLMLASLQARNTFVLQGGDALLLLLLFWGMFLPLGARFSVDAALDPDGEKRPNAYASLATAALLVQVMSVYFFSALIKSSPVWIPDGTAVYYALHVDSLATPVAHWLRQFPNLMQGLTYYVWFLELIGPILMFTPLFHLQTRLALMVMFITMHIGFFLCLEIGLFPFISIASLLTFLPGPVWDALARRARTAQRVGLRIYYDEPCTFCRKVCLVLRTFLLLPDTPIEPAQSDPEIHAVMQTHNSWVVVDHDGSRHVRWDAMVLVFRRSVGFAWLAPVLATMGGVGETIYATVARNRERLGRWSAVWLPYVRREVRASRASNVAVALLALLVLYVNVRTIPDLQGPLWRPVRGVVSVLRLNQQWNMFAPTPPNLSAWYVALGETDDGAPIDVYRGVADYPTERKADYLALNYPTYRWRKYVNRMVLEGHARHRPNYLAYLCRDWNRSHGPVLRMARIRLYGYAERTQLDYRPTETERVLLAEESCEK